MNKQRIHIQNSAQPIMHAVGAYRIRPLNVQRPLNVRTNVRQNSPKGINADNPVQAVGAARGNRKPAHPQPRSGLNYYVVPGYRGDTPTPSCASLARGYPRLSPSGNFVAHSFLNNEIINL